MSRSNVTATEALRRLVSEVKLLDAAEVGERWNQLGGVLAVAEGVLRDGVEPEPVGYVQVYMGGSVGVRSAGFHTLVDGTPLYAVVPVAAQPVGAVPAANQIELAQYFRAAFDTPIARRKWDGGEAGEFCRKHFRDLLDAAPVAGSAAPSGEVERDKLALAYGILWHVNAGMEAPAECNVLSVTPERAAYEARKALRDMLTKEQRGHGIHAARESLAAITATKE